MQTPALARYQLSRGSERLLRSLKSAVQVEAYVTTGSPQLDRFTTDLKDLLAAYERQSQGMFQFVLIEANDDDLREQARSEGLQEQAFEPPGAMSATKKGFLGLVFHYGQEKTVIPALPSESTDGLEYWVSTKIREIRDRSENIKHRIGVISGKRELKLSDNNLAPMSNGQGAVSIQSIFAQAFPFYQLEEVDLRRGEAVVDANLSGLIITQPQEDYREPELRRIDDFLMLGGKSLVVFASAVNLKPSDSTLQATLSTRGLEPLLDGYGIHINKDAVFDHGAQFRFEVLNAEQEKIWLRHPGIPYPQNDSALRGSKPPLDTTFPGFFRMDEVMFPFASSLRLLRDKQPADVVLRAVARSTPSSHVEQTDPIDMKLRDHWDPKPPLEQRVLAAYTEGKLQSAFADRRAPRASRVLVIASSEFITNPFLYAGQATHTGTGDPQLLLLASTYTKHLTSTLIVLKNCLDWMLREDDLVELDTKQ